MNEMKTGTVLTDKNMESMISWLRGEGTPRPEFAERFMTTLHLLYMSRSDGGTGKRSGRDAGGAALSLRAIAGEPVPPNASQTPGAGRQEAGRGAETGSAVEDGTLPLAETGERDSLEVAFAVRDIHERIREGLDRPGPTTMSLIQAVLYIAYGICLNERKERIIAECPQMWRYGPVFARVYTKMPECPDAYPGAEGKLRREDPHLHAVLEEAVRCCIDLGMGRVAGLLTGGGSPWRRCLERSPGRWGTVMDDTLIADWFSRHPFLAGG